MDDELDSLLEVLELRWAALKRTGAAVFAVLAGVTGFAVFGAPKALAFGVGALTKAVASIVVWYAWRRIRKLGSYPDQKTQRRRFKLPPLTRFLDLFGFLFPRKLRKDAWEPTAEELKEEWLLTRSRYRTGSARRWLGFCFSVRVLLLVLDTFRVGALSFCASKLPQPVQRFWRWLSGG